MLNLTNPGVCVKAAEDFLLVAAGFMAVRMAEMDVGVEGVNTRLQNDVPKIFVGSSEGEDSERLEQPFVARSYSYKILHHLSVVDSKPVFEEIFRLDLQTICSVTFHAIYHELRKLFQARNNRPHPGHAEATFSTAYFDMSTFSRRDQTTCAVGLWSRRARSTSRDPA